MINKYKDNLKILFLFFMMVFGILALTGTFTSGMHFVDDHEFLRFNIEMHEYGKSIPDIVKSEVERDMYLRFRPLYYPVRVVQAVVFGTNLFAMSIFKALEVVLSLFLVYLCAKSLGCSKHYSVATALFVMVGAQSAVWWKLGPQECTATWLFMLATWLLIQSRYQKKQVYNIISIILFIMISLYKESFIMLFPGIMLLYIYLSFDKKEKVTLKSMVQAIKENVISLFVLGIVFIIELYFIVFKVGVNQIGYAGIDTQMTVYDYLVVLFNNLRMPLRVGSYALFAVVVVILLWKDRKFIKKIAWQIFMALVIILPQMILHSKCGLEERYIIPWVFGVAYLFIVVVSQWDKLTGMRRKIYNGFIIVLMISQFIVVIREASYFTLRGKSISQVLEMALENSDESTYILSAFYPYDESDKTTSFWLQLNNRNHAYVWRDNTCTDWSGEGIGEAAKLEEMDIIMFYNNRDRHYMVTPNIDLTGYQVQDVGTLTIAIRND